MVMSRFPKNVGDLFRKRGDSRPVGSRSLARAAVPDTRPHIIIPCGGGSARIVRPSMSGEVTCLNLSVFRNGSWVAGLAGPNSVVNAIVPFYDSNTAKWYVVVGGQFTLLSGAKARVARWDGTTWSAMGSGFNGTVYDLCVYQGRLYAGGAFTLSGATVTRNIAVWDVATQTWNEPPFGLNNTVRCLYTNAPNASDVGVLIGGGEFTADATGAIPLSYIFQFDNDAPPPLPFEAFGGVDSWVRCIARINADAVAFGGEFVNLNSLEGGGPAAALHLAKGTISTNLGSNFGSLNITPYTMCGGFSDSVVYVGGAFLSDGGANNMRYLVRLKDNLSPPTTQEEIPNTRGIVLELTNINDVIYAGGQYLVYLAGQPAIGVCTYAEAGDVLPLGGGLTPLNAVTTTPSLSQVTAIGQIPDAIGGGVMVAGLFTRVYQGG